MLMLVLGAMHRQMQQPTCQLRVKLIEGLDGQQLVLPLVLEHPVHLTPHHKLRILRYLELAIPAQHMRTGQACPAMLDLLSQLLP